MKRKKIFKKASITSKKRGFSIAELVIGVAISAIMFSVILPAINTFFKFYKELKYNEFYSNNYRIIEDIENLIQSTSIESHSTTLSQSYNLGFKVLNTSGVYLNNSNGKSIKNYILDFGVEGDTLYIEIPFIKTAEPITFSNKFHIYRFKTLASSSGEQALFYIPGKNEGSKTAPLHYGLEEKILTKIYHGYFLERKGGVIMSYINQKGEQVEEFFPRSGEL